MPSWQARKEISADHIGGSSHDHGINSGVEYSIAVGIFIERDQDVCAARLTRVLETVMVNVFPDKIANRAAAERLIAKVYVPVRACQVDSRLTVLHAVIVLRALIAAWRKRKIWVVLVDDDDIVSLRQVVELIVSHAAGRGRRDQSIRRRVNDAIAIAIFIERNSNIGDALLTRVLIAVAVPVNI